MRPLVFGLTCAATVLTLTECAVSVHAEASAPPFAVPQSPETIRVRVLYARAPAGLSCTGGYRFQPRNGGKLFDSHGVTRARAMGSALVFGQKSFKGDVVATSLSSTDTLKLNGRKYRGLLVFHPLGRG